MKTRTFVAILIFYLSVMVIADSCVTGKKASSSKEDEVLCGTWVNLDYDKTWKYGKIVIKPDGSYDEYDKSESVGGGKLGYAITEKWTDSDGNIFYKYTVGSIYENNSVRVPTWYYLARIDSTGNVFEYVDSGLDFPTEIDLNHPNYAIHYRNK
jgi:hypothetical protein